jgi:O-antigen ligase
MWVVLAAGVAAIVGSFLPWATVSAPIIGTISKSGTDGSDGWVSVGLGALLVTYSVVRLWPIRLPVAVTALAGLVAALLVGFGIVEFIDLSSKADEAKSMMAGRDDPFGIGAAFSKAVQIKPGAGLWLVTAAGLVGVAALLIVIVGRGGSSGKAVGATGAVDA